MKYIIASDIHGSAERCEQLLARYGAENAEKMLLLGDIMYHGPRNALPGGYQPGRVAELLNAISDNISCVRGNCDAEIDLMLLDFRVCETRLTFCDNGLKLIAEHGHHYDALSIALSGCDIYLYGHTHIPAKEKKSGVWCLNPGSVSIPKAGSECSYMTFDADGFVWRTLDGREYDRLDMNQII